MVLAVNRIPWTFRRRGRESSSSPAGILITDVEGWHVSHHVNVSLMMLKGGDILWIFPTDDEKTRNELRSLLADVPAGRLRLHGTTSVGPGALTGLCLPVIVLVLFSLWNAVSESYAPLLVLLLIGPLALLFSYLTALLILLWPEELEVPEEPIVNPSEHSAQSQRLQVENGGNRGTAGEVRLSETVEGTTTRWFIHPSAVFTSQERAALGTNEAEVLKTIIEERAQLAQTIYRS